MLRGGYSYPFHCNVLKSSGVIAQSKPKLLNLVSFNFVTVVIVKYTSYKDNNIPDTVASRMYLSPSPLK